jgi:hypothetical protein
MNYKSNPEERRKKLRRSAMSGHTVYFFPGALIYQLKAKGISQAGIGVIVGPDPKFLTLVQGGQEMNVELRTLQESRHNQWLLMTEDSRTTN